MKHWLMVPALLLATPLCAQTSMPVAGDSVELVVTTHGSAQVPADGYLVTAYHYDAASGVDFDSLRTRLAALESPRLTPCGPAGSVTNTSQFVVNQYDLSDYASATVEMETHDMENEAGAAADAMAATGEWSTAYTEFTYSAPVATRDAAEQAAAILSPLGIQVTGTSPFVADCDAGSSEARADALSQAVVVAQEMADAMGLRMGGIVGIEVGTDNYEALLLQAYEGATFNAQGDTVHSSASLKVTFRLDR